ncbi:MAG: DUF3842 family protein [Clostridia bacterium]|nr:DUF3842 family protein [Clostridia bacterium]
MRILIIDGQGGRLGARLAEGIRGACPGADITAVGTSSAATSAMLKTGCVDHAATGENAVIVQCRQAGLIVGPIGIAMADALLGEVSPAMANAVASSPARRVLIPMNLCDTYIAGVTQGTTAILEDAIASISRLCGEGHDRA